MISILTRTQRLLVVGTALAVFDGLVLPLALAHATPKPTAQEVAGQWFLVQLLGAGVLLWWIYGRRTPDREPEPASAYGSHGSARFATARELRSYLKPDGPGLIFARLDGRYLTLPPDPKLPYNRNVTVIGGSGTRKTRSFVQPNILQTAAYGGESLIVIDPKGENYARSAALLEASGCKVHVLNLLQMDRSDRWNPLDVAETVPQATDLAVNLVANTVNPNRPRGGDPFWDNAEQAFITALVLYIKRTRPRAEQHMPSVLELGTELAPDDLDELFLDLPPEHPARRFYRSFLRAEEKIRAGVVAGLGSRLQLWNSPEVAALTATSDFDIKSFGRERQALFLIIPDSKATYAPLLALFWQQVFELLYQEADATGGALKVPVRCVMDEIANCGFIPDYEKKKSTMRSRGISTEEIWQGLGQIKARYPTVWAELLANSDHLLFLGTNDLETAEYISKKLGQTTLRLHGLSSGESDRTVSHGRSLSYGGRPLLTPDEVMRLDADHALLIPRAIYPAKVAKADFLEHPLAGRIVLRDHKQYQPAPRAPLVVTDVRRLWQALHPATERAEEASDPAPAPDPTGFLDQHGSTEDREELHEEGTQDPDQLDGNGPLDPGFDP